MTDTQRMQALVAANEVRFARAELKRGIKGHTVDPIQLLQGVELGDDLDALVERAKLEQVLIVDFLQWIPYIGYEKSRGIVCSIRAREGLTLGHLIPMRRRDLINRLRKDLGRYTTYRAGKSARVGTAARTAITA